MGSDDQQLFQRHAMSGTANLVEWLTVFGDNSPIPMSRDSPF
jgi:hypothetical protein